MPPVRDTGLRHDGFDLHVAEFDDQGVPWNQRRLSVILERIRTRAARPVVLLTFIHGWKHNASTCDDNLACFREVLEVVAKGERRFADMLGERTGLPVTPRAVVGVYIGWRGGSIKTSGVKELSFWGRKHTAHTIGNNGAVTGFIEGIREAVHHNVAREHDSSVVFVGHSFGAAVLLSAVGTSLNGAIGRAAARAGTNHPVFVPHNGDLFVLVNPALEGSRYENIFNSATSLARFSEEQLPLLITMGSEADRAVRWAFPVGQAISTWARSVRSRVQWQALLQGVALYTPYHTHRLEGRQGEDEQDLQLQERSAPAGVCACTSGLSAFGDRLVRRLEPVYRQIIDELPDHTSPEWTDPTVRLHQRKRIQLATYRELALSTLEPVRTVDPNLPFLTVQVDARVIGGHSDVFNPSFLDFLVEFMIQVERKRDVALFALQGAKR